MAKTEKEKLAKDWSDTCGSNRDPSRDWDIEAGCGLGRCVFYLSDLGFNIVGLDLSESGLRECKNWAEENGYAPGMFRCSDVRDIPYPDNHFSSYLSFGVIEHFEEGPHQVLEEAYRVLRGGGVAVISTPNSDAYHLPLTKIGTKLRSIVAETDFYQYEFSAQELAYFAKSAGFEIIEERSYCLKWPLYRIARLIPGGLNVLRRTQTTVFPLLDFLEKTPLNMFGVGSLIVAIKPADHPHCFFCGQVSDCQKSEAHDFSVPICEECANNIPNKILSAYQSKNVFFESGSSYRFSKSQLALDCRTKKEVCFFCDESFETNKYFMDYGFSVPACPACLKDPLKGLELSNYHLKYAWFEM